MRHVIYICLFLFTGTVFAQEKPKEVKEEVEVKTIKIKDNEKTTENKVKVVTRETNDIELNENDKNKTNQERIPTATKVEKLTYIDNDGGDSYDVLTKETSYKMADGNYVFSPSDNGFEMSHSMDNNQSEKIGKSWAASIKGYYIVDGTSHSGIGYFDKNGNFVTEYYNKDTKQVEIKTYLRK
ncbi:hypothetical protein [Confluentibacter sediminis]|uniref:hypothetical protein n=1 Tax=Confluentibacter sediminis TaxID=2219045 RepID=UPI000DAB7955|nr:hypothetical protein [Confluentibacter sediminis]